MYNWKEHSWALARFCSKYFDIWWNEDKYDWKGASQELAQHCSQYFDKWWNPFKFNVKHAKCLEMYCGEYKHIWQEDLKLRVLLG